LAFPNPYAIAGEGFSKIEDAPAIAAVVLAILSKNPRRLTSPSFDIESADDWAILAVWIVEGTNADAGDRRARAAQAADRREEAVMVDVL